uniref:GTP-binding protein n=1 Tax=Salmonella sp. ZJHZ21_0184 TaxID=3160111 RepID=UPI003754A395
LFDTPGFNLFTYDTKIAMGAADSALVLVDGVAGVEVVTEKVWEYAEGFQLPRAFFVNKLDRERADFQRTVDNIVEIFGRHAVPVQWPIGVE